jgi:hypothetical protein
MHRIVPITIGAVALAVSFGCAKEPKRAEPEMSKTTPSVTETERPGNEAASDINPATARLRVSDLKVGRALAADGTVAENIDEMLPGEKVQASIAVGDIGAGSTVKAVWIGPDDQRLGEQIQEVRVGSSFLVFEAPDTKSWPGGDYKVEIYLGDELAASESFDIVTPKPA